MRLSCLHSMYVVSSFLYFFGDDVLQLLKLLVLVYFTALSVSRLQQHSGEWQEDRWIGEDLEGSGNGPIEVISRHFPGCKKKW
jgi:hypothetical protein